MTLPSRTQLYLAATSVLACFVLTACPILPEAPPSETRLAVADFGEEPTDLDQVKATAERFVRERVEGGDEATFTHTHALKKGYWMGDFDKDWSFGWKYTFEASIRNNYGRMIPRGYQLVFRGDDVTAWAVERSRVHMNPADPHPTAHWYYQRVE